MTQCLVPHCRNRSRLPWAEYLCGPHFKTVPKPLNRKRNRVIRALTKRGEMTKRSYLTTRAARLDGKLWERIKASVQV